MSERPDYFKIGLLIVVGSSLLAAGIIVFGAGDFFKRNVMMETYFTQSVQGLDVGSPVKYRGVKLGEVREITLVSDAYDIDWTDESSHLQAQYVMIRIALNPVLLQGYSDHEIKSILTKLVKDGLRFKLNYLGITGLAYLEADFVDPDDNPPMPITWKPQYYYLPSTPNTIARLEETVNGFMKSLDQDFFPIMKNLNSATRDLPELMIRLNETLKYTAPAMRNMRDLSASAKHYPSQLVFGAPPQKPDTSAGKKAS